MTALNKQALIAKIKKQTENFDTVVLKEDEANALLSELESQQTFQQAFFRQSLMYDVVAEAYEEAKEQIAKDVEIKTRLCLESNSLFDRLRSAEKRIAELEARTITVKFEPIPMEELGNRRDGKKHPYMFGAGYNSAVVNCESVLHQACAAAGIGVKGK